METVVLPKKLFVEARECGSRIINAQRNVIDKKMRLDRALSNCANLSLTKTNLVPEVFVAASKSNIFKLSPNS